MSINRVILSGNLTREATLKQTATGVNILHFSMAVNDRRKNGHGEWQDFPNYVECTMFGARAEHLASYLLKGVKVTVEGKLRWSQWDERDTGKKRSKLEVIVDELELMQRSQQQPQQQQAPVQEAYEPYTVQDDIPF